ncbi:MAG: penicillin-binding transpeptidase domain-containing protein [Phycisphaerales bacterium]
MFRLAHIQLNPTSAWQGQLEKIKISKSTQLASLRGRILDRNDKPLAGNEACFTVCIDYKLSRLADERFWIAQSLRNTTEEARQKIKDTYQKDFNSLNDAVFKLAEFKQCTRQEITDQINSQINDPIWNLRLYIAGKRKFPNSKFADEVPDMNERLRIASEVDIAEMHQPQPLIKLETEDEVVAAQLKFINIDGLQVLPSDKRIYPYKNTASQLIGWVRPWNPDDNEPNDYSLGDMTGFSGIEYICEPVLRGKSGKIVYDIDGRIVSTTERQLGSDVKLTIDIDLQQKIENLLNNPNLNPKFGSAIGIVVVDVKSTDILAMISVPDFDLNTARQDYGKLVKEKNKPLLNRNLAEIYPPGSSAKPIILAIAMAEKRTSANEVISCPSHAPPSGWPRCWIFKDKNLGHDEQWAYEGGNRPRNAIKGSCNVYFSRLGDRIEPRVMQEWLLNFGFGKDALATTLSDRNFVQSSGNISSVKPTAEYLGPIYPEERKFFGIGQGSFRANPLHVANAYAAIARAGYFQKSRIFTSDPIDPGHSLNLNDETLNTIYDGMYAVVNETYGTASEQFSGTSFSSRGIKVYGKTGSTERPYHAWFAGFAKDSFENVIAFSVIVEGGQHGGSDAGPLARDIVSACVEQGYLK